MNVKSGKVALAWLAPVLLGACASVPNGPSAMVLPGTGKSFEQFRSDDMQCRSFAQSQNGGVSAQQAGVDSTVRSAALGTALGAVAGAAINGGHGAGVGAGAGLVFGTLAGAGEANRSTYGMQRRYDAAYQQCMYASGNKVPAAGQMRRQMPANAAMQPPNIPPPNMPPPDMPPPRW